MPVPFRRSATAYQTIKGEIDRAIAAVIRDNAFIRGPYVDAFERQFASAKWTSSTACPAPAAPMRSISRMAALERGKPGDEVITTAHSWISTSAMITRAGATVVFCSTNGATFTIEPAAIEAAIRAADGRHHPSASLRTASGHGCDHGDRRTSTSSGSSRIARRPIWRATRGQSRSAPSAQPQPVRSIRARTWVRWAMPARSL